MSVDLSFLYPLYSLDPRAVWKGQLVVLLAVGTAAAVMVIPVNPESRGLRWLKRCGGAAVMLVGALQFALLIRYLFYPSYLNHQTGHLGCTDRRSEKPEKKPFI